MTIFLLLTILRVDSAATDAVTSCDQQVASVVKASLKALTGFRGAHLNRGSATAQENLIGFQFYFDNVLVTKLLLHKQCVCVLW